VNSKRAPAASQHKLAIPPRAELSRKPLLTERLLLEPITSSMHRKLFSAVDEARSFLEPWLPWVPFTDSPGASLRYTEACELDWDAGLALRFALRLHNTPELIGVITLENCSFLHRSCDLGYWLHPRHTGQGLMTEGALRVVSFAFDTVGVHRIRCAAALENTPSQRVIQRLGFQKEGSARDAERVSGRWVSHFVYSRLATDTEGEGGGVKI
jgi:RimJ/RimL family protein N-acetyltransferase